MYSIDLELLAIYFAKYTNYNISVYWFCVLDKVGVTNRSAQLHREYSV